LTGPKESIDNDGRFVKRAGKIIMSDRPSTARLHRDLTTSRENNSTRKGSKLKETVRGISGRFGDNGRHTNTFIGEPTSDHQTIAPVITGATEDENRGLYVLMTVQKLPYGVNDDTTSALHQLDGTHAGRDRLTVQSSHLGAGRREPR
jgi:hypothetical protein